MPWTRAALFHELGPGLHAKENATKGVHFSLPELLLLIFLTKMGSILLNCPGRNLFPVNRFRQGILSQQQGKKRTQQII